MALFPPGSFVEAWPLLPTVSGSDLCLWWLVSSRITLHSIFLLLSPLPFHMTLLKGIYIVLHPNSLLHLRSIRSVKTRVFLLLGLTPCELLGKLLLWVLLHQELQPGS